MQRTNPPWTFSNSPTSSGLSLYVFKADGSGAHTVLEVAVNMRTWAKLQGIQVIHCLMNINETPFPTCKGAERVASYIALMRSSGSNEDGLTSRLIHSTRQESGNLYMPRMSLMSQSRTLCTLSQRYDHMRPWSLPEKLKAAVNTNMMVIARLIGHVTPSLFDVIARAYRIP